jgi:hypothetical protein
MCHILGLYIKRLAKDTCAGRAVFDRNETADLPRQAKDSKSRRNLTKSKCRRSFDLLWSRCAHAVTAHGRDPLVVATSSDGLEFDRAVAVLSCEALGTLAPLQNTRRRFSRRCIFAFSFFFKLKTMR